MNFIFSLLNAKILPLFNAAVAVCSFCCCFVSTKTDVGKLLTSTVVDNKIEKITPKLYFKNQAILFYTEMLTQMDGLISFFYESFKGTKCFSL